MDLFVYSDESGVFDSVHNKYFVFAGLILLGKENKDVAARKYKAAENALNQSGKYQKDYELKATHITNKEKGKLYRSLNAYYKFAVIIDQQNVNSHIYDHKKSKQRYLDYAYKIGLKELLQHLIKNNIIDKNDIGIIHIYADEHTTATDGKYELKEALLQEYKYGTFNMDWKSFFPPILPKIDGIDMNYCNSSTTILVRAADIIANKIYYLTQQDKLSEIESENFIITFLP